MPLVLGNFETEAQMKQKLGVIATCAALAVSAVAPATGSAGVQERGKAAKCERLLKRYYVALDNGKEKRAKELKKKFKKAGCGTI